VEQADEKTPSPPPRASVEKNICRQVQGIQRGAEAEANESKTVVDITLGSGDDPESAACLELKLAKRLRRFSGGFMEVDLRVYIHLKIDLTSFNFERNFQKKRLIEYFLLQVKKEYFMKYSGRIGQKWERPDLNGQP
jgi:hypothetical protein